MRVRIISKSGAMVTGRAHFSPDRHKLRSVAVSFDEPIAVPYPDSTCPRQSASEEFYLLEEYGFQRMVWGQGEEFPEDSWSLHRDDAAAILAGGGG